MLDSLLSLAPYVIAIAGFLAIPAIDSARDDV